jgi:hypothetical protein
MQISLTLGHSRCKCKYLVDLFGLDISTDGSETWCIWQHLHAVTDITEESKEIKDNAIKGFGSWQSRRDIASIKFLYKTAIS